MSQPRSGLGWLVLSLTFAGGCQALLGIGETDVTGPSPPDVSGDNAGATLLGGGGTPAAPDGGDMAAGGSLGGNVGSRGGTQSESGEGLGGELGGAPDDEKVASGGADNSGSIGGGAGESAVSSDECAQNLLGMACLRGATFRVGHPTAATSYPQHLATVQTFYLDLTEVTVEAYRSCVEAEICSPTGSYVQEIGEVCNYWVPGNDSHPVNCVTAADAARYCEQLDKRLPTEEEWEFATFGGGERAYPWGDTLPDATRANMGSGAGPSWGYDGFDLTAPVGRFPAGATPEGILDLAGNVWEWTSSRYCPYDEQPCNSCSPVSACPTACNRCETDMYVVRGGSAFDPATRAVVDYSLRLRGYNHLTGANGYTGFRCARSADGP